MIFSKEVISKLIIALLMVLLSTIAFEYIENLTTDTWIIKSKYILKAIWIMFVILCLIFPFYLIPYIKNKQKNIKKYTWIQIVIAQQILDKEIKNTNDFFLKCFKPKLLDEPFNSVDTNPNYFVSKDYKSCQFLIKKFKDIIDDLIKYEYIKLKNDDTIELFTYLKKSDYPNARKGMEIFHDLKDAFDKELKQKRFIVTNPKKIKELINKQRLPEKNILTSVSP